MVGGRGSGWLPPLGTSKAGLGVCSSSPSPSCGDSRGSAHVSDPRHLSKQSRGPALQPSRHAHARTAQCPPRRGPLALLSPGRVPKALAPVGGTRRPGGLRGGAPLVTWHFVMKTKTRGSQQPRPSAGGQARWPPGPHTASTQGPAGWAVATGDTSSPGLLFRGSHLRGQVQAQARHTVLADRCLDS